jgi:stage II sporulation SpoAA-like protein
MIEILDETTESCLVVHFSGKVTADKYQRFLNAVNDRLRTHEKVSLVLELSNFEFYGDFETGKKDFKFGFGDYNGIHRVAFVGNKKWIEWFTRLVGPFTRTEEKYFVEGRFEEAYAWACS